MAEGLNRVTLIGNLGADPELKYTQNGQAVLRLRLATSESFLNRAFLALEDQLAILRDCRL